MKLLCEKVLRPVRPCRATRMKVNERRRESKHERNLREGRTDGEVKDRGWLGNRRDVLNITDSACAWRVERIFVYLISCIQRPHAAVVRLNHLLPQSGRIGCVKLPYHLQSLTPPGRFRKQGSLLVILNSYCPQTRILHSCMKQIIQLTGRIWQVNREACGVSVNERIWGTTGYREWCVAIII